MGTSEFWKGKFGDDYARRNTGEAMLAANTAFFANALRRADGIKSVIEFGANIGMNLSALRKLLPLAVLEGVEINESACREMELNGDVDECINASFLEGNGSDTWDLVLCKGVLIHIAPEDLSRAYEVIYNSTHRYVLMAEYFAATPTMVPYRGETERMWRRDFAGEFLDAYADVKLVDYGFWWSRDPMWRQDSLNWWLMERR